MQVYRNQILDVKGQPIAGADVHVYRAGTSSLARVYTDHGEHEVTQPLKSGKDGYYEFKAAPGGYSITATKGNWSSQPLPIILSLPQDGIYNVKDYGAVGDGIAEDYASVYACTNAALAGNGIAYFPSGTYYMGTSALVLAGGQVISWLGSSTGNGATLKWDLRSGYTVVTEDGAVQDVEIASIKFINGSVRVNNEDDALKKVLLSGCEFQGGSTYVADHMFWAGGFGAAGSAKVSGCHFHSSGASGLRFTVQTGALGRFVIQDTHFENVGQGIGSDLPLLTALALWGESSDASIELLNCRFSQNAAPTGSPVNIASVGDLAIVNCISVWSGNAEDAADAAQYSYRIVQTSLVRVDGGSCQDIGCVEIASGANVDEVAVSSSTRIVPGVSGGLNEFSGSGLVLGGGSGPGWTGLSQMDRSLHDVNIFPDGTFRSWLHMPNPSQANVTIVREKTVNQTGDNAIKITPMATGAIDTTLTCEISDPLSLGMLNRNTGQVHASFLFYVNEPYAGLGTRLGLQPIYSGGPGGTIWTAAEDIYEDTWIMANLETAVSQDLTGLRVHFQLCSAAVGAVGAGDYLLVDAVYVGNRALRVTHASYAGMLDTMVQAQSLGAQHGANWAEYGSAGTGSLNALNYYVSGDILYLASPTTHLGHICTSQGAGGSATWGTFGAIS